MVSFLIAAIVLASGPSQGMAPAVPAGTNQSFLEAVLKVEDALEKGDFAAASRALSALPKRKLRVKWDDKAVPAGFRAGFAAARDAALQGWQSFIADYHVEIVPDKADLVFQFSDDLPESPEGLPAGAVHMFSVDPADPRLVTVIGTKRGRPSQPASAQDVRNEVTYAVSAYYGIERTHFPGTASFRSDLPLVGTTMVGQGEALMLGRIFRVVDRLAEAVAKKEKLVAARPRMQLEPLRMDLPPANQGDPVRFSIQVTNSGNATLNFRFVPDCGCIAPSHAPTLEPGGSTVVTVNVDTVNFVGELRHKFFVFSNDPEIPYREFPVSIDVEPLFRFVRPGPSVVQMGETGAETTIYLLFNPASKMVARDARLEGNAGSVHGEPWEGEITDRGKKLSGKGMRYHVKLARTPVPGRTSAALVVSTDNVNFPVVRTTIFAQRGIVALPEAVYFGEIPKSAAVASTRISRPDLPFKVLKVETDRPFLKATVKAEPGGAEYRVVVEFDGNADFGPLQATVTVTTDDPKQPKVVIPVMGTIR